MQGFDSIVVGAGIAGASVAAHVAQSKNVLVLDMEERAGFHTTGRSAASYEPNYGPPPMLAFTRASESFFKNPPQGFTDGPLLVHRNSLFCEAEGQEEATAKLLSDGAGLIELGEKEAQRYFPVLKPGYAKRAFLDPNTGDIDVDLLHRGYLRWLKERGGKLALNAEAQNITRQGAHWHITTPQGLVTAPTIVNASGAWGDVVANRAGVKPIGLVPKRRSIGVIPLPNRTGANDWPMVSDTGETWYAKPQSGKMIVSSADATPVEPHDAYADDMAIAEGVDRLCEATTIEVDRMDHSWGGLRTFAPDGNPVLGFDPLAEGFFWLVGQGGYGIQSCPALSQSAARQIMGMDPGPQVIAAGLNIPDIRPERFAQR